MRVSAAWSFLASSMICAPMAFADDTASGPAPDATEFGAVCEARGSDAAKAMLSGFTEALASRHPDKVTRLFAPDATFLAFHADGVRGSYDSIRDAFVYFLVSNPEMTFSTMTPSSGCGVVAIEGEGVWRRPANQAGASVATPVRISMVLVDTPEGWRIQQYADERLEAEPSTTRRIEQQAAKVEPEPVRRAPAVAGFVARSRAAVTKPVVAPAQKSETGGYRPGRWQNDVPAFD